MPATDPAHEIQAYYRSVGPTLFEHLRGRQVTGSGFDQPNAPTVTAGNSNSRPNGHRAVLHIDGPQDLDEAVRSGVVCFRLAGLTGRGLVALRVRPGAGAGIDTVATAALALAEAMAPDGLAATAMTDGTDGLYLIGFAVGPIERGADAASYATELARRAPEIATLDQADFEGRAVLQPLPGAVDVPAPYSLVPGPDGWGVVVPLTLDEVAAASAGMPVDFDPTDVPERIQAYGDLAAALGEATALPA